MTEDRIRAKQRMRRLRAEAGGRTLPDEVRQAAIRRLIRAHQEEFESYRKEYYREAREAADANRTPPTP